MSRPIESRFLIRPLEAVHFGPPRPFDAGESHRCGSLFPPTCYTFQGMIRSQLLRMAEPMLDLDDRGARARDERAALVGGPDALPDGWQLTGPLPARVRGLAHHGRAPTPWTEPWIPTPRFMIGDRSGAYHVRIIPDQHPAVNDLGDGTLYIGLPELDAARAVGGWIDPANLALALTGMGSWSHHGFAEGLPPFVHWEHRPGLALDGDTARHGMLYFLETLRFEQAADGPSGLLGWLRGHWDERLPATALTGTLGAAGRKEHPAAFIDAPPLAPVFADLLAGRHLPDVVAANDLFWLVTLTPVTITEPMKPLDLVIRDVRFNAVAMLTGQAQTLGGYRFADASTRPNRGYLPGGTCWLFRLDGADAKRRAEALQQLNNAHVLGDLSQAGFGFGHTLVGLGPVKEEYN